MVKVVKDGDPESKIGNLFEELINNDTIAFKEIKLANLPNDWARLLVNTFLEHHNIRWWLGDITIEGVICIKVDDPFLQYIDIYPNEIFAWSTDNHHDGVHPDTALVYILNGRKH